MKEETSLAERFEEDRPHLRAVAYRMLGSLSEADDAVQESWLRLSRADPGAVENLSGWMTTIVARVCLDMLRARRSRREESLDNPIARPVADSGSNPEHELLLAESVGLALLVVLDTLPPAERITFVLHDTFGLSFGEVAPIVGRSPAATRQLASRARRRLQKASTTPTADLTRQRTVVDAFLAATRSGDFEALLAVLDPDIIVRADSTAVKLGAAQEMRGAKTVLGTFLGRAQAAQAALIGGTVGMVWVHNEQLRVVFLLKIRDGKIAEIDLIADPTRFGELQVTFPLERTSER